MRICPSQRQREKNGELVGLNLIYYRLRVDKEDVSWPLRQKKKKLRLHFNINTIICVELFFYLSFIVFPALDLVSAADL